MPREITDEYIRRELSAGMDAIRWPEHARKTLLQQLKGGPVMKRKVSFAALACAAMLLVVCSCALGLTLPADEALLQSLKQLLVQHDVAAWRGFSLRRLFGAADKASFTLTADFADGSSLAVNGGAPAEGFGEFCAAMHALFAAYLPA